MAFHPCLLRVQSAFLRSHSKIKVENTIGSLGLVPCNAQDLFDSSVKIGNVEGHIAAIIQRRALVRRVDYEQQPRL